MNIQHSKVETRVYINYISILFDLRPLRGLMFKFKFGDVGIECNEATNIFRLGTFEIIFMFVLGVRVCEFGDKL